MKNKKVEPGIITPDSIPSANGAPVHTGPQFETSKPRLGQRACMYAAGLLVGLGRNADPMAIMDAIVQTNGGYKRSPHSITVPTYHHPEASATKNYSSSKNTTTSHYSNTGDALESAGAQSLFDATQRTVRGERTAPTGQRVQLKARVAKRLVGQAIRTNGRVYSR